jgi:hypothetical protein
MLVSQRTAQREAELAREQPAWIQPAKKQKMSQTGK